MRAVILTGGLGVRLRPLTEMMPKPLLPIGPTTVVEILIRRLAASGASEVFLAAGHRAQDFRDFVARTPDLGVPVRVSEESKPLGTCGPLTLLGDRLREPFILLNGDILTTLDFRLAYDYALGTGAELTAVTTIIETPFEFGRVVTDGRLITGVQEKPDIRFEILAGIYVLRPEAIARIPRDTYYGIDRLIKDLLAEGRPVGRFLCGDYWLDIGRMQHYREAQDAYRRLFADGVSASE
ncbi:MAG: NTP transferase domain-containing protein [Verrucomicrobiae bacterium]|nr:NTP transferase domain-containing protein [Verrucomicrobiae bacterium]